jgi:hypothetical protein
MTIGLHRHLGWGGAGSLILLAALTTNGGCSAAGADGADGAGAGGPTGQGGAGAGATGGTSNGGAGGGIIGSGSGGGGGLDECAGVSKTADGGVQPADIIIAVDTSGSMNEESGWVQQHLNGFATQISQSGIDVHVILIADAEVCIPSPLGSGSCGGGDENLPNYRHVVQTVGSNNSLELILSTYPQYVSSLRPNATKTIAVVSDDDSAISASQFTTSLLALDPPTFVDFKFDAIVSFTEPLCFPFPSCPADPCCLQNGLCQPLAADEGKVYKDLVMQTQGVSGNLCLQDFQPVFDDMATAVVSGASISCDYEIPDPPEGETLDPGLVNVHHTPGGSTDSNPILFVPGGLGDCGPQGGWYYDDPQNPTTIHMCPATCTALQGDPGSQVDVVFGCTTESVPK